jgi:hypothetical protein
MVDILTQPNKKREDRIHSRSPGRRSNYQTATSTYDNNNNTNTFMQKTKYQNTYHNKHNEMQNKNQKRK